MNRAVTQEAQFWQLTDPRINHTRRHKLIDIVMITTMAAINVADSWKDIAGYGKANEKWLRKHLELPLSETSFLSIWKQFTLEAQTRCLPA